MNRKICQTLADVASSRMRLLREECLLEKDRLFRVVLLLLMTFVGLIFALATGLVLGVILTEGEERIVFLIACLAVFLIIGGVALYAAARLVRQPVFPVTAAEFGKDRKCLESALGK